MLSELCNVAIEGPAFPVNRLRSPNAPPRGNVPGVFVSESLGLKARFWPQSGHGNRIAVCPLEFKAAIPPRRKDLQLTLPGGATCKPRNLA